MFKGECALRERRETNQSVSRGTGGTERRKGRDGERKSGLYGSRNGSLRSFSTIRMAAQHMR